MASNNTSKNEIIIKPFIYGSVAFSLGKKANEEITHKWCTYVRGVNNEDISAYIKEVHFILHNSFANHIRKVTKWPFELYEIGWGEFDVKIKIFLVDETIKPLEVLHPLKLYPLQSHASSSKRPVVIENYDEIIFVNPKPALRELLLKKSEIPEKISSEHTGFPEISVQLGDDDKMEVDDESVSKKEGEKEEEDKKMTEESGDQQSKTVSAYIPNISSYFQTIDDSTQLKELEDSNTFVSKEIENLKEALLEKEKEIGNLIKAIKEFK